MTTVTIFQRGNTSSSLNTIMKDITGDSQKHYFANNTEVYFAIRLTGPTPEKLLDTSYFKFELVQKSYIKDNSPSGHSSSSTPIEYEYWGDRFPHVSQEVYNRAGLSTYLCPKHTNFFVRANYNSDNYEMVQINTER